MYRVSPNVMNKLGEQVEINVRSHGYIGKRGREAIGDAYANLLTSEIANDRAASVIVPHRYLITPPEEKKVKLEKKKIQLIAISEAGEDRWATCSIFVRGFQIDRAGTERGLVLRMPVKWPEVQNK
ncbi:hypothetical protein TNCV_4502891 [Trichonephila clavipes]|nr:hypothetical protein TNCV_4502891 [Trichonephila clavipes]